MAIQIVLGGGNDKLVLRDCEKSVFAQATWGMLTMQSWKGGLVEDEGDKEH